MPHVLDVSLESSQDVLICLIQRPSPYLGVLEDVVSSGRLGGED